MSTPTEEGPAITISGILDRYYFVSRAGRLPDFDTDAKESFMHTLPFDGEGGCRETKTIQCRADGGGAQAGGHEDTSLRPQSSGDQCESGETFCVPVRASELPSVFIFQRVGFMLSALPHADC